MRPNRVSLTSANRIIQRPPRPFVLADNMKGTGVPLGQKLMSPAQGDAAIKDLIGLIANSTPMPPLDDATAQLLKKVLDKHANG